MAMLIRGGTVVTAEHRARVEGWIQTAIDEGAELVVDGRGFKLQGHEDGFFVGPTLLDRVTTDMKSYHEEIFGPVLQMVRAPDFETAEQLYIDPGVCIDCDACVEACPVDAIFPDFEVPEKYDYALDLNAEFFADLGTAERTAA